MNFFWVFSGKKIKRYSLVAVAILFVAGIIYTEKESVQVFTNSGPDVIYSVNTTKKQIALTFDICWGEERPISILDILEQKGIKNVTFFLSAPWAESHPDIVKRIVNQGYEIGSHGNRHDNYSQYDDEERIRTQLRIADRVLTKIVGKKPSLIRYPNGDFDKRVLRIADQMGYKSIQWGTDSLDWLNPGVDKIINRVVTKAHPGDIVLMHASDTCTQTHEALPAIIDRLGAQGYQFLTASELLLGADVKIKLIQ